MFVVFSSDGVRIPYTLEVSVDFGAGGPSGGPYPPTHLTPIVVDPPGASLRFENFCNQPIELDCKRFFMNLPI